jgi:anti-sigma regulatory factor (Ser/Thr protein kinase)
MAGVSWEATMSWAAPFVVAFPSDTRLLGLARSFVEQLCRFYGMDPCGTESLVLAVHEAVQNVIRHAHRGVEEARIELSGRPLPAGALEIQVIDQGEPFDISRVPHWDPGEMRLGGRGVFLIRRLVDELYSEPLKPRGNRLRLVKYRLPVSRPREV